VVEPSQVPETPAAETIVGHASASSWNATERAVASLGRLSHRPSENGGLHTGKPPVRHQPLALNSGPVLPLHTRMPMSKALPT